MRIRAARSSARGRSGLALATVRGFALAQLSGYPARCSEPPACLERVRSVRSRSPATPARRTEPGYLAGEPGPGHRAGYYGYAMEFTGTTRGVIGRQTRRLGRASLGSVKAAR